METVGNASTNVSNGFGHSSNIMATLYEDKGADVILPNNLFHLLASVKEINLVTNMREVLDGLKQYISAKHLFDPLDPRRIDCKNDELGSVLGIQKFSIYDIGDFLPKLLSHVDSEAISNSVGNHSKRKFEETDVTTKKSKLDEIIISIPPSPIRCSVSDSTESLQGYETAIAKDTSDENVSFSDDNCPSSNYRIVTLEGAYDIEIEIDSPLSYDSYSTCRDSDSDSETEVLNSAIISVLCKSDSDMEFWADKSSDDDINGSDAEILYSDKWVCVTCSALNGPLNRFCEMCFNTRKGWLPNKRKKRKSKSERKRVSASAALNKVKESTKCNRINLSEFPSTSSSSQEIKSSQCTDEGMKQSNNFNLDSDSNLSNSKLCIICCERPANGTIVHNHSKYAHTIACYICAKKLKNHKKKCPICRRSIDRVVYQILP